MTQPHKILLLIFLTICEISCFFFVKQSAQLASLVYAIVGIGIALIPLLKSGSGAFPEWKHKYKSIYYGLYLALILLICNWTLNVFRSHVYTTPIEQECDMLIFIKVMAERYLAHQHVYDLLPSNYGGPIHAVYLPAFWLPYSIPIYYNLDMRWATVIAFIAAIVMSASLKFRSFQRESFLLLAPITVLTYLVLSGAAFYLIFTQDALVLFYAAVLALALSYECWWVAGVAAACCVLSRYFIGIPFLAGMVWLFCMDRKAVSRALAGLILMLVALLTFSHSWQDIGYFFEIPFLYMHMLKNIGAKEFHDICCQSIGISCMLDVNTVHYLSKVNLAISIFAPLIYFILASRYLADQRKGLVILCGIKLFLVLFLITLSLPYMYVFYTSSIVSIILCRDVIEGRRIMSQ